MDEKQKQALRAVIRERIDELEEHLGKSDSTASDGRDQSANLDRANESDVSIQLTVKEKRELHLLRNNLLWLDSDDAGNCEVCGCEIPLQRLKAVPTTRQCVNCAEST